MNDGLRRPTWRQSVSVLALVAAAGCAGSGSPTSPSLSAGAGTAGVQAASQQQTGTAETVFVEVQQGVLGFAAAVEDGVTGVLVPPGDPTGLAGAAVELLEDPTRRRGLGEAGRARAETHFGLSRLLAEVRDLYREAGGFHREGPHVRGV